MAENKLADLSTDFAVKILKLTDGIKGHYSLVNQLERRATSIGANITEAQRVQSKADFTAKMSIALKEAYETNYWLRLLRETNFLTGDEFQSIITDCQELERLLISIIKTSKE